MYPEECLWPERNGKDEPTAFINLLSHIAGVYMERLKNSINL